MVLVRQDQPGQALDGPSCLLDVEVTLTNMDGQVDTRVLQPSLMRLMHPVDLYDHDSEALGREDADFLG